MQIICDKCKAEIHPQPETFRDGEIEHIFFRCPECGEVYHLCATDEALRKSVMEYDRLAGMNRKKRRSEQFLRKAAELKEKNIKRCRELMEQYPLAPLLSE
jgi:uncharacterized C2H2 Zn-finger protein